MVNNKSPAIKIDKKLKGALATLKQHKNQSYSDVIDGLVITNPNKSLAEFWENVKEEVKKLRDRRKGSQSTIRSK